MSAKRTSIYLSPPIDELLIAHLARDENALRSASSRIAVAVDRYLEIVRRNLPNWQQPEWCLAVDALNGCWTQDQPASALSIVRMEIADAVQLNGLEKKWEVDWSAFQLVLADLTHTQALAVLEVVERFWADQRIGAADVSALVDSIRKREPMFVGEGDEAGKSMAARAG